MGLPDVEEGGDDDEEEDDEEEEEEDKDESWRGKAAGEGGVDAK